MITTTIPTNLNFPNRGVLERDDFVNAQETAQDLLAGAYTTALNQYATELNDTEADINLKWEQVQSQAVTGGYSQAYIDATFTPKILNTQTDKATPIDADLIPLSDSASSFGLKKLSIVNLITKAKNDIISAFGVLISGLTAKATPNDADMIVIADSASSNASKKVTFTNLKTFLFGSPALTGTPTAPTATAGTNTTQIATTAYVDAKMVLATAVTASGTAIDFTGIPSWVKRITVMFNAVSTNGTSSPLLRVGTAGGIISTGYTSDIISGVNNAISASNTSIGVSLVSAGHQATYSYNGAITLELISANLWVIVGTLNIYQVAVCSLSSKINTGVALDRIRITTINGTDVFDAGSINIMYEG